MILVVVRHPCQSATRANVGAELVLTLCPARAISPQVSLLGEEERRREGSGGEERGEGSRSNPESCGEREDKARG